MSPLRYFLASLLIFSVFLAGVLTASAALTSTQNLLADSFTEAVERGLIEGDPAWYYEGYATKEEYYHAVMTAILAVDKKVEEGTWTTSPTTTSATTSTTLPLTTSTQPTSTSTVTSSLPDQTTSTTTTVPTPSSTSSSTTTTEPTTTSISSTSTSTVPPSTTTTNPPSAVVIIEAGTHNQYQEFVEETGTHYLCEEGAVLDGNNVTGHAFYGRGADDVTIENCEITNYNPSPQFGVIDTRSGSDGWTLINNEIHHNGGVGIQLKGNNHTARNNQVHHQRQLGVAAEGSNILFEDNEIAFSNYNVDYSWGWEAGGSKFWETDGLVVRNNHFHNNHGPGIWADHDNINGLIEGNLVTDNYANGIMWEISYNAVIRNNTILRNGWGHNAWLWGAGILIATSNDVEIYNNYLEDNYNGISITQQARGGSDEFDEPKFGLWRSYGNHIHGNTIVNCDTALNGVTCNNASGVVQDDGDSNVFSNDPSYANVFEHNSYSAGHRFAWENRTLTVTEWRGFHPNDAI